MCRPQSPATGIKAASAATKATSAPVGALVAAVRNPCAKGAVEIGRKVGAYRDTQTGTVEQHVRPYSLFLSGAVGAVDASGAAAGVEVGVVRSTVQP
ncbi:hypothetical protein [Achromobacter sp.]|uniref:hypothetical protein n=1 Tax=Achromobacter sp. TaxID=134375 RepID=UPI00257F987B|nr:hypothetical protein [Achromobacter sp.]